MDGSIAVGDEHIVKPPVRIIDDCQVTQVLQIYMFRGNERCVKEGGKQCHI